MSMIPKHQMSEEDIKLQFITPAVTAKWNIGLYRFICALRSDRNTTGNKGKISAVAVHGVMGGLVFIQLIPLGRNIKIQTIEHVEKLLGHICLESVGGNSFCRCPAFYVFQRAVVVVGRAVVAFV